MIYDLRFKTWRGNPTSYILHPTSKLGFSLVELLVVFSMVAIVSGVGFASFVSYSRKQIVNRAAGDISEVVDSARFNALSSVKPTSSCLPNDELSEYKVNFCLNALCDTGSVDYEMIVVCGGIDNVVKTGKLPQNVTAQNVIGTNNCETLTFNIGSGIARGVPCAIELNGFGNQINITVDGGGHVSY